MKNALLLESFIGGQVEFKDGRKIFRGKLKSISIESGKLHIELIWAVEGRKKLLFLTEWVKSNLKKYSLDISKYTFTIVEDTCVRAERRRVGYFELCTPKENDPFVLMALKGGLIEAK